MKYHIEREHTVGPGQTVGGDVRHVSQSGQREIWKVERLDEGDLGGGELAVRAEFAQRGLEDALAERTCRIVPAWMNGNRNRNRQSLQTLETGARLSLKTCLRGRHGTPRRARQACHSGDGTVPSPSHVDACFSLCSFRGYFAFMGAPPVSVAFLF